MNKTKFAFFCLLLFVVLLQKASAQDNPGWYVGTTDVSHNIVIPIAINPNISGIPLVEGDYIGVFYDSTGTGVLACGGFVRWTGTTNVQITAWGDETVSTPDVKNGFAIGETFKWKIWRHVDSVTFTGAVKYETGPSVFTNGGITVVRSLIDKDPTAPDWDFVETDIFHSIVIPYPVFPMINGVPLVAGDYIGVFFQSGEVLGCAGYIKWNGNNGTLTAYGDDPTTEVKEGFSPNESFQYKLWRTADRKQFIADATYNQNKQLYPQDSLFTNNGKSGLTSLNADLPDWEYIETIYKHVIVIPYPVVPTVDDTLLIKGDYIGAFYQSGDSLTCAGYVRWNGFAARLAAYGDDPLTPEQDGFLPLEKFQYKMWRKTNRKEYVATAVYDTTKALYPHDSLFVSNGLSGLARLFYKTFIPEPPDSDKFFWLRNVNIRFGALSLTSSYRMIGLPGDSTITIESKFFGEAVALKDWISFMDTGARLYTPYTEENKRFFKFTAGKAFWFLSRFSFRIDSLRIRKVILGENNTYAISLRDNWNMISTPFEKSVDWKDVQKINNVSDPIFFYNSAGTYETRVQFEPILGYYFYNRNSLPRLYIPYYKLDEPDGIPPEAPPEPAFTLSICEDGEAVTKISALISPEYSEKLDDADIFAPPSNFEERNIHFVKQFANIDYPYLMQEARQQQDVSEYTIEVLAKESENSSLLLEAGVSLDGYDVYLIDASSKVPILVQPQKQIPITAGSHVYTLLIGAGAELRNKVTQTIGGFTVYQNYPNPFNPQTTIQFALPEPGAVTVTIHNALGEEIYRTESAYTDAGLNSIQWNASAYPSGIYFYTVAVVSAQNGARHHETKKMTVLK